MAPEADAIAVRSQDRDAGFGGETPISSPLAVPLPCALSLHWNTLFTIQDDSEDTLESVHTLAPELLIPAETINSLYNAEECASPEDFLSIYLSPSQPALDSGTLRTVWNITLSNRTRAVGS